MHRTFLRSDSNDLIRLHSFNSLTARSLQHDINSFAIINKLIEELQKVKGEQNQLITKNKQLEEALKQSRRELFGAKKEIEQLRVVNQNFVDKSSQEQTLVNTTYTKSTEMPVPPKNRKRTADEQHKNYCSERDGSPPEKILKPHKKENSRLLGVRNTRISSSCDDLSKLRRDLSPPFIDDNPFGTEHVFETKRNFLRIHCGRCEVAIRFGVNYVKCQRCKATFHEQCRRQAPLPCVVRIMTPKPAGPKSGRPRLGDFCADCRPMVPPLITYCTYHLDNCPDLPFEDIYSNCGIAREVELIAKLFQSNKSFPKLDNYSVLSVAGCVRNFLAQVREPVIPFTYGKDIIKCQENTSNAGNLNSLIGDLPTAHMDTLAHLARHWKRLSAISNDRLTIKALSALLGPLVFGSDRTESPIQNGAAVNAMEALLLLPIDFWVNITSSPGTSHSSLSRNPSQRSNNNQTPKFKTLTMKNGTISGLRHPQELNSTVYK
uniref:Uncharacterized protein n=1 Tax=Meloidogyne enterolobii TaxID=390850 RepID=A0A6V7TKC8_MELEN|nr:unnamed protein product [Meloidogyne enterolobii]